MKENIKTLLVSLLQLIVGSPAILLAVGVLTVIAKVLVTMVLYLWSLW